MINSIISYFRSAKEELEKVSWPTREDVMRYSTIIITVSVVLAVFFAALDFGLHTGVSTVLTKRFQGVTQTEEVPQTQPTVNATDATVETTTSTQ